MDISDKKENRILKYVAIYLTKKMLFFVIFFKNSVQCISHQNLKYVQYGTKGLYRFVTNHPKTSIVYWH